MTLLPNDLTSSNEITRLLRAWGDGDQNALSRLTPLVYDELHRIAEAYVDRQGTEQTLQATALVHEAYLRLICVSKEDMQWYNRTQFYGLAAQIMRYILVDQARRRFAAKRGGGRKISLDEAAGMVDQEYADLLTIDDALNRLAQIDPQQCKIIELRFFGGLSIEETAEFLNTSPSTIKREWRLARAWLRRELGK